MAGLSANLQRLVISQLLENKRNLLLVNLTSSWQKSSSRQGPNLTEIFSQKQFSRYQAKKCSAEDGRHHLVKSDSGSTRRRFLAVLLHRISRQRQSMTTSAHFHMSPLRLLLRRF